MKIYFGYKLSISEKILFQHGCNEVHLFSISPDEVVIADVIKNVAKIDASDFVNRMVGRSSRE